MNCNHNNSYHISTDNTITTWQDIIGDPKKNKAMAQLLRDVLKKVDKEDGKALIPVTELMRLRDLHNYDDTAVKASIQNIQELLDNLDLQGLRNQVYSISLTLYDIEQEEARHAEQLAEHQRQLEAQQAQIEAQEQRVEAIEEELENVAKIEDIPTKVSQLDNDEGFITEADIPTKVSDLDNDLEFITEADIPTKVSDLTNDLNFIDEARCGQLVESQVEAKIETINPLIFDDLDD